MRRIALLFVWGAAACGGGGGGGGGTVGGQPAAVLTVTGSLPLSASSFTAVEGGATCPVTGGSFGVAYAAMIASDQSGICGDLQRNQNKANARAVNLAVIRIDLANPTTSLQTGTYPVVTNPGSQGSFAFLEVSQNDAGCNPSSVTATGGSVQVTSVAGGGIQGTVDATLSDGGRITGTFDAPGCAVTFPGDICTGDIGPVNPSCAK